MLIKTILIFVVLIASVYLGVYLEHDAGYVLIRLHDWSIETSVWVVIISLLILFLAVYICCFLLKKVFDLPASIHKWRTMMRVNKSQTKTRQGLIEFNEGHWKLAKKHLIDALPNAETPLLNYLTAARAAQEMGDNTQRDNYLRQAQKSMPEAKIAVELTQAQLQIANHQWEQALATLQHLQSMAPKHPYVLKLLLQLYEEINDWKQLINLLPTIKRQNIISQTNFLKVQQNAYYHELKKIIKTNNQPAINEFIKAIPKELKFDPQINCYYVKYLIATDMHKQAESILHKLINTSLDSIVLSLYSQLNVENVNLNFLEGLIKNNQNSGDLYLCLGKVCMAKQLWGKAKSYLEQSINLKPSSLAYAALGKLHEQENDLHGAVDAYRCGLTLENEA